MQPSIWYSIGEISNNHFRNQATDFIDTPIQNIADRRENVSIISLLGMLDLRQAKEDDYSTSYGTSEMVELAQFFDIDKHDLLLEWNDFKSIYLTSDFKSENLSIQNLCKILHKSEERIGKRFPLIQILHTVICFGFSL